MKITKSKARETFLAISKLGQMPRKVAYALSRNKAKLRPINEAIDEEVKALVQEHFGEDKSTIKDDPRVGAFNKAAEELMKEQEEEEFEPYRFDGKLLEDAEVGECDPNALESIFWLQKETDKKEANTDQLESTNKERE